MLYEMRTYSFLPTDLPKYLKHAEEVGRPVRGNDYGVNCGYWTSEFGRLNQVWHLWQYESYAQREELRKKLSQNSDWTGKYVAVIKDWVKQQDIRLLNPQRELAPPMSEGNVYEYRYYRLAVGAAGSWIKHFKEGLEHREKYSKLVGLWHTEAGQPNEVSHLWVYPDLNARAAARAGASQDEGWRAFLKVGGPMIQEMNNVLLQPTNYSPMK
jgi:hypothetical protein